MKKQRNQNWMKLALCGVGLLAACSSVGCQISSGGQLLPSGYYQQDDVQYFAPGPEMKLSREAAAMKAYNAEQALRGR
jgi:hypothetical protein